MPKNKKQVELNRQAYATVYETKDVLVAQVTSDIFGVLSLTETQVNDKTKTTLQRRINGSVTTQLDSLVNRLMKILD